MHQTNSAQHFRLRRYQPDLAPLVEQFWLVDWDLRGQPSHTQQNWPDPNMHLVISKQGTKVLGPISKKYLHNMQGQGRIIGVKFNLGVLAKSLPCSIDKAVDIEFRAADIFKFEQQKLIENTFHAKSDKAVVEHLSHELQNYTHKIAPAILTVQTLAKQIKEDSEINRVEILAERSHHSVRSLQRMFKTYVGLSPKWMIRKYRLHHALEMLESEQLSLAELASNLGYADQSHLIRDFNEFLDITPNKYAQAN